MIAALRTVIKRMHYPLEVMHRWAIKIVPVLAAVFRRCMRLLGTSWRGTNDPSPARSSNLEYLFRRLMKASRRPLSLDEVYLRVVHEHALIENAGVADNRHVFFDEHVLVITNEWSFDHVIAHAVDAQAALFG
jgi:hypothetical protein